MQKVGPRDGHTAYRAAVGASKKLLLRNKNIKVHIKNWWNDAILIVGVVTAFASFASIIAVVVTAFGCRDFAFGGNALELGHASELGHAPKLGDLRYKWQKK